MATSSVRYQKLSHLSKSSEGDVYSSLQFERPKPKIPWRAIKVAIALFFIGSILIIVGSLLLAGYIDKKYSDRTWPVLTLGIITFLPGFYHLRIAYYSWMGYAGYSYDDIPHYDD